MKLNGQKATSVSIHESESNSLVFRWMVTPVAVTRLFLPQPARDRCGAEIYTTRQEYAATCRPSISQKQGHFYQPTHSRKCLLQLALRKIRK
jgi:hypothetical protein